MNLVQPGTYILIIELAERVQTRVGSLGPLTFEGGYYLYVGSALGGLRARLARHLRAIKRGHWHIDYLLAYGVIREIWYSVGSQRLECAWAQRLAQLPEMRPYAAPFGASDCACHTHLFYSAKRPALSAFPRPPADPPMYCLLPERCGD